MHKQNKTNRDTGLEQVLENMYRVDNPVQEARPYIDWSKHGGDKVKDEKCPKCGEVHPINASCGTAHEDNSLDDWNADMESENQAGYIQIDLQTGGVQTISPDEVEQAVNNLEHIPSGEGTSDWDAWRGEEYMVVAVPRVVHWPKTAAYKH
jgi:hypothetical protein